MERHQRRRAGRDTRQRRRERQSESRNRSAGPPDGVPERDVRRNGAPCRRDRTGTARNRRVRQNRAGTDTVRLAHQELIGQSQPTGQRGRAERTGSRASLRRRRARTKQGLNSSKTDERLGATGPNTKRDRNGRHLRRNAASQRHASREERVAPRARGSTPVPHRKSPAPRGYPARTGIHRGRLHRCERDHRLPRAHGYPPLASAAGMSRSRAAPRARGFSPHAV